MLNVGDANMPDPLGHSLRLRNSAAELVSCHRDGGWWAERSPQRYLAKVRL